MMLKRFRYFLLGIVTLYLLAATGMFLMQRSLLYKPVLSPINPPLAYDVAAEAITLQGKAGKLSAWYAPPPLARAPVILYFQGNSGNFSGRVNKFRALLKEGFGLLALSYRGFNGSEGEPTESGLYEDARTAWAWLQQQHPHSPVILYGESLGTGVAVQLATEKQAALLVLEAPYTSVTDRAGEMYPWLPVHLLLRDHFDSLAKIRQVQEPLLVFHNEGDAVIPIQHGKKLFAAAHAPKKAKWFRRMGHIDFDWALLARTVRGFLLRRPS